jgi:hypothetical protein
MFQRCGKAHGVLGGNPKEDDRFSSFFFNVFEPKHI